MLGDNPAPDTIIWKVGLGHEDMKALINKDIRSSAMTGIYDAAVKYANGLTVRGWDKEFYENNRVDIITVAAQGGVDGAHADELEEVNKIVTILHENLGQAFDNTLILTLTEFGRTIKQNGGYGTEHGYGSAILMAGGLLKKSQVYVM